MAASSETPVGTPDELRLLNKLLTEWGSCSHPQSGNGKGCAQYPRCIFAQEENGGFRDRGPQNLGVLKVNNETGAAREDVVECFTYMRYMHDHNRAENAALSYVVIAHQGEEIQTDVTSPVDPNNTRSGNMKMKTETVKVTVPPFPRPGMPGSKVEPQAVRAQAALKRHAERVQQARQEARIKRALAPASMPAVGPEPFAATSPTDMVVSPPAPEIPRKPRGRPPKTR